MNGEHLRAFCWLRWRLFVNQLRRGGVTNTVLLVILATAAISFVLVTFVAGVLVGALAFPHVSTDVVLFTWTVIVLVLLFCWCIGVVTELQRSEDLTLSKFLHLPISLSGAFVINYLSSLVSFTLLVFVPAMVGFTLGLAIGLGPLMILLLPLAAACVFMITALTYQFQGWLASLMANKRRRRTIVVAITASVILLAQVPNLVNVFVRPWDNGDDASLKQMQDEQAQLHEALTKKETTLAEYQARVRQSLERHQARKTEGNEATWTRVVQTTTLVDTVLPPGWLPLGAKHLAEGNVLPAFLGTLGLGLIGSASLWRGYRTTLRLYTGQFTRGKARPAPAARPVKDAKPPTNGLEQRLPWLPEPAAAVALATFRSMMRAPEAKMALIIPIILVVVFGTLFVVKGVEVPELLRPLLPLGGLALTLTTMIQLAGNQFGFERNGFRALVLSPMPRREVFLGKNVAIAPFPFGMGLFLVLLCQIFVPLRFTYVLAFLPQMVSAYLLYCLLANWLSMFAPMRISQGSLKASNVKLTPVLLQVAFLFFFPIALMPALLPVGVQMLLDWRQVLPWLPVGLLLALAELVGIFYLYRFALRFQGDQLQAREQTILDVVSTKAE